MKVHLIRLVDTMFGIPLLKILKPFNRKRPPHAGHLRKILAVKFFGAGNLIMMLPSLKALKKHHPHAKITVLTNKANQSYLEQVPFIDEVLYYDMYTFLGAVSSFFSLINQIRKRRFDLAIDFEQFARFSAIFLFLTGIRHRIGFNLPTLRRLDRDLYTHTVLLRGGHMVEGFGDLLSPLGITIEKRLVPLKTDPAYKQKVMALFSRYSYKTVVGVHVGMGPNAGVRQWQKEKFVTVCDELVQRKHALIVFTGSPSESPLVEWVISQMKQKQQVLNLCAKTSLGELVTLMSFFDHYISSDTGTIHLAAAQGVHCIGIYGPTLPSQYGPYTHKKTIFHSGIGCSPCATNLNLQHTTCKNNICMKEITAKQVLAAFG